MKMLDIGNLMSPPEPPQFESFSRESNLKSSSPLVASDSRRVPGPIPPLSPPISPATKVDEHRIPAALSPDGSPVRDPILYPAHEVRGSPHQQPLFARGESVDNQRIVSDHLVTRPASLFTSTSPPRPEHYDLVLTFKSEVMKKFREDPKLWLRRERSWLIEDRKASAKLNKIHPQPVQPTKPQPIRTHAQRVAKPAKAAKDKHVPAPRPIRSNASAAANLTLDRQSPTTPEHKPRRVVAPNRSDKNFDELPDLCPPTSSLPKKANSLKVEWKGPPIDLSNDPNRHLLHPDELVLASNLRLDCATYLTSKRRIFMNLNQMIQDNAKKETHKQKDFKKTDAQIACKIDVNKASRLWMAFEKVGWFDKQMMDQLKPK